MTAESAGYSVVMIEDDSVFGEALVQRLRLARVATRWVRNVAEAEALLRRHRPSLVLCDIRLPDGDGEALIARLLPVLGGVPVVAMTAYGGFEQAVRLIRAGADDYLAKPFPTQRVLDKLAAFAGRYPEAAPEEENATAVTDAPGWRSAPMRELQAVLESVAAVKAPVLLTGESGTGKGVAARRLHAMAGLGAAPFAVVECADLPAGVQDAETALFGSGDMPGLVDAAGSGTLFLDEVADLTLPMQARMLRLIEEGRFRRPGGAAVVAVRARVVATTHVDLLARVSAGSFRSDLWFRLSVLVLTLPPLRGRPDDLEDLALHFLRRFSGGGGAFGADALTALHAHGWLGNVRELRNRVERAVLLAKSPTLAATDLFPDRPPVVIPAPGPLGGGSFDPLQSLAEARQAAELEHIRRVLARCGGRIGDAAEALGVSRTTLWDRMRRLGIEAR